MAKRVPSLSKFFYWISIAFFCSCHTSGREKQELQHYSADSVYLQTSGGYTYSGDTLFSGILYALYPESDDTLFVQSYVDGKEHGVWKKFYPEHQLKEVRYFEKGRKEGTYMAWWENGSQQLSYIFLDDEYEGTCQEWNKEGVLIRAMNYHQGHEEGAQKVWYDNGQIKSNYVVIDGRRYGLLGTKNCINVSDSIY